MKSLHHGAPKFTGNAASYVWSHTFRATNLEPLQSQSKHSTRPHFNSSAGSSIFIPRRSGGIGCDAMRRSSGSDLERHDTKAGIAETTKHIAELHASVNTPLPTSATAAHRCRGAAPRSRRNLRLRGNQAPRRAFGLKSRALADGSWAVTGDVPAPGAGAGVKE